jgi:selenium-binding protein 1
VKRRYLIVPGLRSSRIYVLDTEPDPSDPQIVKIIEPEELIAKTGYSRPHTVHCGPDGIYMSAIGNGEGDGPGGIFLLDHDTFDHSESGDRSRATTARLRFLVAPRLGHDAHQRVGHAEDGRERTAASAVVREAVRPPRPRI